MSDQTKRVGVNEALFREVNERIDQLQDELGTGSTFEIVCECGDAACVERLTITPRRTRSCAKTSTALQ